MDTITLADALAGFTSNESSALGAYIGTDGKQSVAALAKFIGDQNVVDYYNKTLDFDNLNQWNGIIAHHITGTGNTINNLPAVISAPGNMWVIEMRYSNAYRFQFIRLATGVCYTRHKYSTWGDLVAV